MGNDDRPVLIYTTFPGLDAAHWRETARGPRLQESAGGFSYVFVTYERRRDN